MSANETPRTDSAAVTQNLSWGQIGMVPADFARTLERELAEAKADANLQRTRLGAILWSGALDKVTAGEVQDWTKDYQTSLTAATQRIAELEAKLSKCLKESGELCDTANAFNDERNDLQVKVAGMELALSSFRARLLLADRMADEAEDVVTNAEEAYAHRVSTLGILGNLKPAVNAYRAAKERKA